MFTHRHVRLPVSLLALLLLLTACATDTTGSNPTPTPGQTVGTTATSTATPTATSQPTVTTQPVPATQTDCPASGTARALVTAPLALGTDQNIVYFNNSMYPSQAGTFKRYDVTTSTSQDIVKLAVTVTDAQISTDGAWVLFVAYASQTQTLQAVRMDGQGLQTLYCGSIISNVQWSNDQQSIIFNNSKGIFLLNTTSGALAQVLQPVNSGPPLNSDTLAIPFTWLDNTRLYVSSSSNLPIGPIDSLGWFSTSGGTNQAGTVVKNVYTDKETGNYPCWDADSSYDSTTLFVVQCHGTVASNVSGQGTLGGRSGPSKLFMESATGGTPRTIFSSDALGLKSVRAISKNTLLLLVENYQEQQTVDTSQNGLWKINTDGTGLTRLTSGSPSSTASFNQWNQAPWANISRDGNMYALTVVEAPKDSQQSTTLVYGSLSEERSTTFAHYTSDEFDSIVGWTTI